MIMNKYKTSPMCCYGRRSQGLDFALFSKYSNRAHVTANGNTLRMK